jgi:hypothetical protein
MPRTPDGPPDATTVTRRRFLKGVVLPAAAVAAAPTLIALGGKDADAAVKKAKKPAAPAAPAADTHALVRPDFSVAHTPAEREALEKQWKQMLDTVATLRKVSVPVGSEIATGALAPRRLRRGEA